MFRKNTLAILFACVNIRSVASFFATGVLSTGSERASIRQFCQGHNAGWH